MIKVRSPVQRPCPRPESKLIFSACSTGNRITPSYVAFTDEERLVGDAAKNQAAANPSNTIFDIKYVAFPQMPPIYEREIYAMTRGLDANNDFR